MDAGDWIALLAAGVAVVAICVAVWANAIAKRGNLLAADARTIARRGPWVEVLMDLVRSQLAGLVTERANFLEACAPTDPSTRGEALRQWQQHHDQLMQQVHNLSMLEPAAESLLEPLAALHSTWHPGLESERMQISTAERKDLHERHRVAMRAYAQALQAFVKVVMAGTPPTSPQKAPSQPPT